MSHRYVCPLRWGDMDAQGHVNNGAFVDYLQDARVHFLLTRPAALARMLDAGVLVISHQVEYLREVVFADREVVIDLWVDDVGASRFVIGYDVTVGGELAARARTALVPFDLAGGGLRRLTPEERSLLAAETDRHEPLRRLAAGKVGAAAHRYPLLLRWSDMDAYAHANNVKFYDYVQEARIAMVRDWADWPEGVLLMVVRQDVDYVRPLDFRLEPYEVATVSLAIGNRSFTLGAEIREPSGTTVFARAKTVVVSSEPLTPGQRLGLERIQADASPAR